MQQLSATIVSLAKVEHIYDNSFSNPENITIELIIVLFISFHQLSLICTLVVTNLQLNNSVKSMMSS